MTIARFAAQAAALILTIGSSQAATFDYPEGGLVVYHLPLSVIAQTHLVDLLLATPRGRFSFACGAAEETLDQAVPAIRGMLDGVTFSQ